MARRILRVIDKSTGTPLEVTPLIPTAPAPRSKVERPPVDQSQIIMAHIVSRALRRQRTWRGVATDIMNQTARMMLMELARRRR